MNNKVVWVWQNVDTLQMIIRPVGLFASITARNVVRSLCTAISIQAKPYAQVCLASFIHFSLPDQI